MTTFDNVSASTDSVQLELSLAPLIEPTYSEGMTLADRFEAWHAANPHVADALEVLAAAWLENHEHVGMGALYERLRWESGIQTEGDAYKLNNSYRAFHSRVLLDRHPAWTGRIRIREQKAAAA